MRAERYRGAAVVAAVAAVSAGLTVLLVVAPLVVTAVVAGLGAVALLARDLTRGLAAALAIATLPLFVDPSSMSLTIVNVVGSGGVSEEGSRLQPAFAIIVAAAVLTALPGRRGRSGAVPGQRIVVALLLLFTTSIVFGLLTGSGPVGLVFYVQTVVPLLAWVVTARSRLSPRVAARTVMLCVLATLVLVLGYVFTNGGLGSAYTLSIDLESAIPQYRSYFPAMVAFATAFAVARWSIDRPLSLLVLAGCIASVPFTWSRNGLAMVAIAAVVAFLARPGASSLPARTLVLGAGGIAGGAGLLHYLTLGVIGERSAETDLGGSDDTRLQLAGQAVVRLVTKPLLGEMFHPYDDVLVGGVQADFARLFPSHNQYLDYGLRGGVLALVLLAALLVVFARRSWRLSRTARDAEVAAYHAGLLGVLAAVAFGSFFALYVTQTWTGTVLMMLIGVSASVGAGDRGADATGPDVTVGGAEPARR